MILALSGIGFVVGFVASQIWRTLRLLAVVNEHCDRIDDALQQIIRILETRLPDR